MPAIVFAVLMGLTWHALTKPDVVTDTTGLLFSNEAPSETSSRPAGAAVDRGRPAGAAGGRCHACAGARGAGSEGARRARRQAGAGGTG